MAELQNTNIAAEDVVDALGIKDLTKLVGGYVDEVAGHCPLCHEPEFQLAGKQCKCVWEYCMACEMYEEKDGFAERHPWGEWHPRPPYCDDCGVKLDEDGRDGHNVRHDQNNEHECALAEWGSKRHLQKPNSYDGGCCTLERCRHIQCGHPFWSYMSDYCGLDCEDDDSPQRRRAVIELIPTGSMDA